MDYFAYISLHIDEIPDLKLSTDESKMINFLIKHKNMLITKNIIEDFLVKGIERKWVIALCKMVNKLDNHAETYDIPIFPISGNDLIERGIKPGIEMGKILKKLFDLWKESRYIMNKDELLKWT